MTMSGQHPQSTTGHYRLAAPSFYVGAIHVHHSTVAQVAAQVRTYRRPRELRRMSEAVHGWRGYYEMFLKLVAETREQDWPFQNYPAGWSERARSAVWDFQAALGDGFDCHFPERASSNLRQLSQCLELAAARPQTLCGRQVGLVRRILTDSEARWGPIGSEQRTRAVAQRSEGGGEQFEAARESLLERLSCLEPQGGIQDLESLLAPTDRGIPIPAPLAERVRRAWLAPAAELVKTGVIESPHGLAQVSGQWTDQALRGDSSREALRAMVELAWSAFPQADLSATIADWNRLLLAAGSPTCLTEARQPGPEHLHLARATALSAQGTLYESYYALPTGQLLDDRLKPNQLWELCRDRARARFGDQPQAGQIVEELRILTSQGLWALYTELRPALDPMACARKILAVIAGELKVPCPRKYQRWQRHKRIAHAWQRLVFFLSLVSPESLERFAEQHLGGYIEGTTRQAVSALLADLRKPPKPSQVLTGWCDGNGPLTRIP